MPRPKKPNPHDKVRLHRINEWAEKRNLSQVDFVDALGVDKGTVSRWFAGMLPSEAMLPRIAAFLNIELDELFRDPYDDWLRRFFEKKGADELYKIRQVLEITFPDRKTGTNN